MTTKDDHQLRTAIISTCRQMNNLGINQGTSGNVSARVDGGLLISPSAVPYDQMEPVDIVYIDDAGNHEARTDSHIASTEWRFHLDILNSRADIDAVVHCHSMFATILSTRRQSIPALHYMIAATGASQVRCAKYATYGTAELSANALEALAGSDACLLANHGTISVGADLAKALWLANEVETLAKQYVFATLLGGAEILPDEEIERVKTKFKDYGIKS